MDNYNAKATEILDYIRISGVGTVQGMLDLIQQEGVCHLYKTKQYKELPYDLLYGVYTVILMNIKLSREYKKTKVSKVNELGYHMDDRLYLCEVTMSEGLRRLGKDHYTEFLDHVMRTQVAEYVRGLYHGEEDTNADFRAYDKDSRGMYNQRPLQDIILILVTYRHYHGRYAGREGFDLLVNSLYEELYKLVKEGSLLSDTYKATIQVIKHTVKRRNYWGKLVETPSGMIVGKYYGLTDKDKAVIYEKLTTSDKT